jgi:hypothetical protein
MKVHIFTQKRKDQEVHVYKSSHTSDKRDDSWYERDTYIDEKRYREIIEMAFKQGLTEFKDKGAVAVCFFDDLGYKHTLLLNLNDKGTHYEVFIITAIYSKRFLDKAHFIKCHNRLNIWHWYTMKSMSYKEKVSKKLETRAITTERACRKEDDTFYSAMKVSGIKRLNFS